MRLKRFGRALVFRALAITLGAVVPLALAELVLRALPVNEVTGTLPVSEADPILRYRPDRMLTWSKGWSLGLANQVRVNNAGFIHARDYDAASTEPLVAVVGDSYVEALMVPHDETLTGRLESKLRGTRVYAFGISGAPLSQYLAYAEHARDIYRPDAMVFVTVSNDYDESFHRYKGSPGFHYFAPNGPSDQPLELVRADYTPGHLKELARSSALVRYLVKNVEISARLARLRTSQRTSEQGLEAWAGQTAAIASPERLDAGRRAIEAFFTQLPERSGLPPERLVVLLDGLRPQLYDAAQLAAIEDSFAARMRIHVLAVGAASGIEVIDLQALFREEFAQRGERFEFVRDAHWNGRGHTVAARAALASQALAAVRLASTGGDVKLQQTPGEQR